MFAGWDKWLRSAAETSTREPRSVEWVGFHRESCLDLDDPPALDREAEHHPRLARSTASGSSSPTSASKSPRRDAERKASTTWRCTGGSAYWDIEDINASLTALLDAGAQERQGLQDVGGGKLVAWVTDGDGNGIGLIQNPEQDGQLIPYCAKGCKSSRSS